MPIEQDVEFNYNPEIMTQTGMGIGTSSLLLGYTIYAAIYDPPKDPSELPWLYGLMIACALTFVYLVWVRRLLSFRIVLSSDAVSQRNTSGANVRLGWHEIKSISHSRIRGFVVLESSVPSRRLRVEKQLLDFNKFMEILKSQTGLLVKTRWW